MLISRLMLDGYIKMMLNLRFILLWIYIIERPSKVSTIIYSAQRLVLILSEEICDDMYFCS